jgi:ectoine hydroxylase-related dioxygenase (phytanoyl-CoA dioxygenase family)
MSTSVSSDLRQRYLDDGFVVAERVIPQDVVQRALDGMDAVRRGEYDTGKPPIDSPWKPGDDPNKLCKIEMPHLASKGIREILTHPALGEVAAAVTGAKMVQIWWVQLLYKPPVGPNSGTNVGWHQDKQYWKAWTPDSELFTAWLSLSDVTADSGPVKFLRGSHKWGLIGTGDFFGQSLEELKESIKMPKDATWDEVAAIMPPGSVSFHHNLTYHGSGPNTSSGPRRSFAIHMRTEKSTVVDDPSKVSEEEGRNLVQFIDNPEYSPIIYDKR